MVDYYLQSGKKETTWMKQFVKKSIVSWFFFVYNVVQCSTENFIKICQNVSENEPDETQTKAERWAKCTGSAGGMETTSEDERSRQLPMQPSLPPSKCTAWWCIPHPDQKESGEDGRFEERDWRAKVPGICWVKALHHFTLKADHFVIGKNIWKGRTLWSLIKMFLRVV